MTAVRDAKRALRVRARAIRAGAARERGAAAAEAVARHVLAALGSDMAPPADASVAGYWPMEGELDIRPLLTALAQAGHVCALPCVAGPGRPLAFRRWRPGDALHAGVLGIMEPGPDAAAVTPEIVLAPLLAFDRTGYRLGQGKGYYDRTLTALRGAGAVLAIGVGFAAQEVDAVPHDDRDARLDWIVTEAGARRAAPSGRGEGD